MGFIVHNLILLLIYFVLVGSYNLMLGSLGILHFGQVAFFALGAYTSAMLTLAGVPFIIALPIAMAVSGIMGFLIGIPCLRIKGHYLALATLGLSEVIRLILLNSASFTGGPIGIRGIPKPEIFGITLSTKPEILLLYALITFMALAIIYRIMHSPYGKVLESIREDEVAAESLGKNIVNYKMQIFTITSSLAGLAGSMYAHSFTYIDPSLAKISAMNYLLVLLITGGAGNFWGAIIGPIVIVAGFESMRLLPIPSELVGTIQQILYGLLFILIILFRPQGICSRQYSRKKITA
jgi:branched-chain amino acid transport system permease protein